MTPGNLTEHPFRARVVEIEVAPRAENSGAAAHDERSIMDTSQSTTPSTISATIDMVDEIVGDLLSRRTRSTPLKPSMRFAILDRDDFTCQYCGLKAPAARLHVDHVHPRSKGGDNSPDNLVAACIECNLGKHASELDNKPTPQPLFGDEDYDAVAALHEAVKSEMADLEEQVVTRDRRIERLKEQLEVERERFNDSIAAAGQLAVRSRPPQAATRDSSEHTDDLKRRCDEAIAGRQAIAAQVTALADLLIAKGHLEEGYGAIKDLAEPLGGDPECGIFKIARRAEELHRLAEQRLGKSE